MASQLPLIPQFAENFILNWSDKRQPKKSHRQTIDRRRLYILPTRAGIIYFIVLMLILFAAINYENSLGFMLAFLLSSLGFIGMIYSHQNINQLTLNIGRAESVFVGQDILYPLTLSQPQPCVRASILLQCSNTQDCLVHLINEQSIECKLPVKARTRGYAKAGRIKLYSEYPLGLFHSWSWLNLDAHCLVYPEPWPKHFDLISAAHNAVKPYAAIKKGVDDFAGIRQYQEGDQPNHMAWKAIAKTGELQTKLFNSEQSKEIWIDWCQTDDSLEIEQRLSILCRMVLDANQQNISFGLGLPGCTISNQSGSAHKHQCLKALALFGST